MTGSIASLYLLTTLVLGGTYLLYETKDLPTTYQYENALMEATQAPHIAKLTISPTISYGGTGDNSLRKITHAIQLLSESKTNKGLVIDLAPCDETIDNETVKALELFGFVNYTILKDELDAYKEKTNRKIIVHVTKRLAVPFLLILAIADQVILDTTTIVENTTEEVFSAIALSTDKSAIYIVQMQEENKKDTIQLKAGKYKLKNDREESEKILNEYKSGTRAAIRSFEEKSKASFPRLANLQYEEIDEAARTAWKQSLCTYLEDYGSGKRPEEVEAYTKGQIEQVRIIDLHPCINDNYTPAYTPQQRNAHRRTEACFETIMISGDIDDTLVNKIKPLIQSVHCDPKIKGVIIVWDSSGGKVPSAKALLRLLKKLDAAKPIIHVATSTCASGAYLLAAGTGVKLTAYHEAQLGSIGAKVACKLNIDNLTLRNLAKINEALAQEQQALEETRQWLIQVIAQNRAKILGVNQQAYRQKLSDTEARTYIATRAEEEQLIDKIGTLEDAIDALKAYTGLDLPVYYSENEAQPIDY